MKLYLNNYHHLGTFDSDTIYAMLVDNYAYDAGDRYVVDVSEYEVEDASYSRKMLSGNTRVVSVEQGRITLGCDDVSFGAVTGVELNGLIVYKHVNDDADSLLLGYWSLEGAVLDGSGFDVVIPVDGLVVINNA